MSWPLFCHNASSQGNVPVVIPVEGTEITAELINTSTAISGFSESYLACYGDKILFKKYADQFVYSDDGGDTWTDKALIPMFSDGSFPQRCERIEYHPASGGWILYTTYGNGTNRLYHSADNGATWDELTMAMPYTARKYTHTSIVCDSLGRVLHAGKNSAGNGIVFYVWNDPTGGGVYDSSYTVATAFNNNIENFKELDGFGYAVSTWDGYRNNIYLVPYSLDSKEFLLPLNLHSNAEARATWSYSINGVCYVWDQSASSNPRFIKIYNGMTLSLEFVTIDFAANSELHRMQAGPGYWLCASQPNSVSSMWKLRASTDDAASFGSEIDLILPVNPAADGVYGTNATNLYHAGGTRWLAHYSDGTYVRLVRFDYGTATTSNPGGLETAIEAQSPDIFMKMDDTGSPASVEDIGRKGYSNSVVGSPVFEQAGIVDDGGTAVSFGSTTDEGVIVADVPAPIEHAHVFVFQHDGTAVIRALAGSGDITDTTSFSYYIYLTADHKIGIATFENDEWTYSVSSTVVATDTDTLAAVRFKTNGEIRLYLNTGVDSDWVDVFDYTASSKYLRQRDWLTGTGSGSNLSVGGAWEGDSALSSCADGVTLDFYVLIHNEFFDFGKLAAEFGGSYTKPAPGTGSTGPIFLIHADDPQPLPGPFKNLGQDYWTLINSVPGSTNTIHTAANPTGRLTTTDKKFGVSAINGESNLAGYYPFNAVYWYEGYLKPGIEYQEFSYDVWVKPTGQSIIAGSSQGLYRRSGKYYVFGGISIVVYPNANTGMATVVVKIGCSLEAAYAGKKDDLIMTFSNVPGWTDGSFNHIAVSRSVGRKRELSLGGPPPTGNASTWHVFVNGNKAGVPSVIENTAGQYEHTRILKAGQWMIGSMMYVFEQGDTDGTRLAWSGLFDEARLIVGEALFTEAFTPPTEAYS